MTQGVKPSRVSLRTGHRAARKKVAGGSGIGHQFDLDENAQEKRARREQERWRDVTLPPCKFLGRPDPYNWADALGGTPL